MASFRVPIYSKHSWLNDANEQSKHETYDKISLPSLFCVTPGDDTGFSKDEFLKGHGVYSASENGNLLSCVRGECVQIDQVISVLPLANRYSGSIGDVVVGRVVLVGQNRWFVDLNGTQDAILPLTSVHLPDGEQRRRTAKDEMQMRDIFTEGDMIVAEVQNIYRDGAIVLQTRSKKFGELSTGVLIQSKPILIKHLEQHIVEMNDLGVRVIFGLNGYVWISPVSVSDRMHREIAQVSNAVKLLMFNESIISPESIRETLNKEDRLHHLL